jgi:hypothetical protein
MPPKKKGKKGGKKGGKKKGKDGELTEEDKLKLKIHEVESLKDHLAFRNDFSRKTNAAYEEIKDKLEETNNHIDEIQSTHKNSSGYLTNQYKLMQNEIEIKMHMLESELKATRKKLDETEVKLADEIENKKAITETKNEEIEELEQKVKNIIVAYESVISSHLNEFNVRLDEKKPSWQNINTELQPKSRELLAELSDPKIQPSENGIRNFKHDLKYGYLN